MIADEKITQPGDSLAIEPLGSFSEASFYDVYELGEEINEGAFGVVYKALHLSTKGTSINAIATTTTSTTFAVKVQDRECNDPEYDNMIREVSIMRDLLDVPNIIQLIDFYMDDEKMYVVQTFAKGGDVLDRLTNKENYCYKENDARELIKNLLFIIQTLHKRNIIHRDLKPENLLLKDENNDTEIYLCDFGFTKMLPLSKFGDDGDNDIVHRNDDNIVGKLSTFVGTPAYVAPEIIEGKQYRGEVDMWSIGCIAYILLSGYLPFGDETNNDLLYNDITESNYDFNDNCWINVSDDAKSFISNLLLNDQECRWTPSKAVQCNWFIADNSRSVKEEGIVVLLDSSDDALLETLQQVDDRYIIQKPSTSLEFDIEALQDKNESDESTVCTFASEETSITDISTENGERDDEKITKSPLLLN